MNNKEPKFKRYIWLIPFIIGIVVGVIGILKLNEANSIHVPNMGKPGWFDAKSQQADAESLGMFLCFLGFFGIALIGSIACAGITRGLARGKNLLNELRNFEPDVLQDGETEVAFEDSGNLKECEYCGSLMNEKSTECLSCGGKKFKKHKG